MLASSKLTLITVALVAATMAPRVDATEEMPFIEADGAYFATVDGERINFQGVNLGNWFMLEAWMFNMFDISDQHTILQILSRRFGNEKRDALIERHRETWITEEDFRLISEIGMNCVRLPFHYTMLVDINEPDLMSKEGFAWLDLALEMARENELYVILDLHGAPGGQCADQPSGRVGSNGLWGSQVNHDLTVRIWEAIALRYKDHSNIAAFDIINEPYGAQNSVRDPIRRELRELCERIYHAIRAQGNDHVILFPGTQLGIFFYRSPEAMGAYNLGFTDHFYPGIFHGEAHINGHARFIDEELYPLREYLRELSAPFLVGEFNVVLEHSGGDRMMQEYWELYETFGWAATMWCWKLVRAQGGLHPSNWYLLTNASAMDIPDLYTANWETISAFFDHADTQWVLDTGAVAALHGELEPRFHLESFPTPRTTAPESKLSPEWNITDIGIATNPGSARFLDDGTLEFYGNGDDIFGEHDGLTYVYQSANGDFVFEATFEDFEATRPFAKSGLMVRTSLEPAAAMALVHVFSDGSVALAQRTRSSAEATEVKMQTDGFPLRLRIESKDGEVIASWKNPDSAWTRLGSVDLSAKHLGFASSSNHLHQIAFTTISDYHLKQNKGAPDD